MDLLAFAGIFAAVKELQTPTIKPLTLSLSAKGAADIEKGNKFFLAGNFKDASAAYDDASVANDNSPVPWINGGLSAKELGKLGIAKLAMNTAFHMGDQSVKGKVISAGIDLARKQFEPSKSKYQESLFINPNEPFGLLGFAQWNLKQAHLREGERFMWQGYRQGAPVVMDSKLHNENSQNVTGGTGDGSILVGGQMLSSDAATAYQAELLTQTVGGSALQQLVKLDFATNTPFGVLAGNHRGLQSDRPGTSMPSLFLPSSPGSRLDLRHTMIGLQNRIGDLTFHANYRQEFSSLRSFNFGPMVTDNRIHQYILETRYDSGQWMAGTGYSKVSKSSSLNPAIEPLEAIFPQGTTNMYNGYLVNRQDLNQNIKFTSGAIYTSARGTNQAGVMGQLAIRTFGNRYLRIGVKPGINRVQTNLGPINDMIGSLGTNPLDRLESSALEFNRDIALPSLNSRLTNTFVSLPLAANVLLSAFRNSFTNQNFIGTDPQTSSQLNTTRVTNGQVTGIGIESTSVISNATNLRLSATVQSSSGTYAGPTLSLTSGNPQPVKVTEMPNIPRFEASASFDWSTRSSTFALAAHYVGSRTQVVQSLNNGAIEPGGYVSRANPGTSIDAHFSLAIPSGGAFEVSLLNLSNNNFYPGFRSSRQVMIGYSTRM